MASAQRPAPSDLNVDRLIADTIPGQIRGVQQEIIELKETLVRKRALLDRLVETAIVHDVALCPPAPALELLESPKTQTPPTLAGVGGGSALRGGA